MQFGMSLHGSNNAQIRRVFVIEDDDDARDMIAMAYEVGFPPVEVVKFPGTKGVVGELKNNPPDLVSLDLGLPDGDGLGLIREIRTVSDVPIIVVSARDDDSTLVAAVRLGADAFLVKPISLVAIQAHVEAFVRQKTRAQSNSADDNFIHIDGRTIDLDHALVEVNGISEPLTKIELEILRVLSDASGRIVPIDDMKVRVWDAPEVTDATVKTAIYRLRQKLQDYDQLHPIIVNHRSVGYSLAIS